MSESNEKKTDVAETSEKCVERIDEIIRTAEAGGRETLLIRENIIRVLVARNLASVSVSKQVPTHYLYNRTFKLMKDSVLGMSDRLLEIYKLELQAKENQTKEKEKQI